MVLLKWNLSAQVYPEPSGTFGYVATVRRLKAGVIRFLLPGTKAQ